MNSYGCVIGVNTFIYEGNQGLNFALSSKRLLSFLENSGYTNSQNNKDNNLTKNHLNKTIGQDSLITQRNPKQTNKGSLFGINFYSKATDYFPKYLIRSAEQDIETLSSRGYKSFFIDKTPIENIQLKDYWITISSENNIHKISGNTEVANEKYCLRQIKNGLACSKKNSKKMLNLQNLKQGK